MMKTEIVDRILSLINEMKGFERTIDLLMEGSKSRGIVFNNIRDQKWTMNHQRRERIFVKLSNDCKKFLPLTKGSLKDKIIEVKTKIDKKYHQYDKWIQHLIAADEILSGKKLDYTPYCFVLALRVLVKERIQRITKSDYVTKQGQIRWFTEIEKYLTVEIDREKLKNKGRLK